MTLEQYVHYCRQVALFDYNLSFANSIEWKEKDFESDWRNGIAPTDAVRVRMQPMSGRVDCELAMIIITATVVVLIGAWCLFEGVRGF